MSSKVKGFVERRATPPTNTTMTPTKKERQDRAQGIKVGSRSSRGLTKPPPTESDFYRSEPSRSRSTDQPRTYTSNYQAGKPYLEPHNDRQQTRQTHPGNTRDGNGFDNTVSTNFDHTRSESPEGSELSMSGPIFTGDVDAAVEYGSGGFEDGTFDEEEVDYNEDTQHVDMHVDPLRHPMQQSTPAQHPARPLHHKENFAQTKLEEPHIQEFPARHGSDIAGRFAGPTIQNVQARAEVLAEPGRGASKKRGHSQHTHEPNNFPIRSFETKQTGRFEINGRDVDPRNAIYEDDEPGYTSPARAEEAQYLQNNGIQSSFPQDDGVVSAPNALVTDHSDEELAMMDYAQLKSEDWGYSTKPMVVKELSGCDDMGQTLEVLKMVEFEVAAEYFEHLPDGEWDKAGQLITAKLAELMANAHELRKRKRDLAAKYEQIYEQREQLLRSKDEKYEAQLGRMKNRGKNLLQAD